MITSTKEKKTEQGNSTTITREVPLIDKRLRKLEMHVYKGEELKETDRWFYQLERYFEVNQLLEKDKLDDGVMCLDDDALERYQWESKRTPMADCGSFCEQLLLHYRPTTFGNRYVSFIRLQQETIVRDYHLHF